jgi:hypothetical protein
MVEEDIWPEGYTPARQNGDPYPFPRTWMNYSTASSFRKTGPVEQFYTATDALSLIHNVGMAEAIYYRDVIERQRRGRPASDPDGNRRCGGYLVWKFNDSWPQIYSAKVDYFQEPLHTYYTLKRSYRPVMLSFDMSSYITLWAVNDSREIVQGTVTFKLFHIGRNKLTSERSVPVEIAPGESKVLIDLYKAGIASFRLEHVLYAELKDGDGEVLATTHRFADIENRINFPDARLEVSVEGNELTLTADKYARTVYLTGDADGDPFGWFFGDNYFDLFPGEVKKVRILGDHKRGTITAKPWYSPHETSVEWEKTE